MDWDCRSFSTLRVPVLRINEALKGCARQALKLESQSAQVEGAQTAEWGGSLSQRPLYLLLRREMEG